MTQNIPPLSSPFADSATHEEDADDTLDAPTEVNTKEVEEESQSDTDSRALSNWKQVQDQASDSPQDNGGGISEWKTKRKRNGLKGRTPKHPMNKRPYTC